MSQKRKSQRARHAEKEEQKAKKVINWIFGVLIIFALAFVIISMLSSF